MGDGVKHSSGQPALGLAPGSYAVRFFNGGPGYSPPANMLVSVTAGNETDLTATYTPNIPGNPEGSYLALMQGATYGQSGYAELTVKPTGSFSGTFSLGGSSVKVRHAFAAQGQTQSVFAGVIALPDGRSFNASLSLSSGAVLAGTLTNVSDSTQIVLSAARTAAHADQALAGVYTAVLPAVSGTGALPGGAGFGALTLSATGGVKFAGKLGDGVPVKVSGALDSTGVWSLLFARPATKSAGAELLLGSVSFPVATNGPAGTLSWYRTADKTYPGGFSTPVTFLAAPYAPPAVTSTSAKVTFSGADIGTPIVMPVTIDAKGKVTSTGAGAFTLKFTPKTGLFTGRFQDNGSMRAFSGAMLQSESLGLGLFQDGSGQTGSVVLEPTQ